MKWKRRITVSDLCRRNLPTLASFISLFHFIANDLQLKHEEGTKIFQLQIGFEFMRFCVTFPRDFTCDDIK